jgi:chromosome segregation ATPase
LDGGNIIKLKDLDLDKLFSSDSKSSKKFSRFDDDDELEEDLIFEELDGPPEPKHEDLKEAEIEETVSKDQKDHDPIPDEWSYSDKNVIELLEKYKKQQEKLDSKHKELQTEFEDWKNDIQKDLDKQNEQLTKKEKYLLELEKKNKGLEGELKSKLTEYEKQSDKLRKEREKLTKRELELEKKSGDYEDKVKNFDTKLNKIETQSEIMDKERAKLVLDQKRFAEKVNKFEEKLREEINQELNSELIDSQNELNSEWDRLRAEEERLSKIYHEIVLARDKFKNKVESQFEELNIGRTELAKEWAKLKEVRKHLDAERNKMKLILKELPNLENGKELSVKMKRLFEDQMLAELENGLRSEIDAKVKLETELTDLGVEPEIHIDQYIKPVPDKKNTIKNNFEKKLKRIKKLFKKNKRKTEKLNVLVANLQAEQEKSIDKPDLQDTRREDLDKLAEEIETQRKELDKEREEIFDEWSYIKKEKEKLEEERHELDSSDKSEADSPLTHLVDEKYEDTLGKELTEELNNLQTELKDEWSELKAQHERLSQARKEFSEAKSAFGEDHEVKLKKLRKMVEDKK